MKSNKSPFYLLFSILILVLPFYATHAHVPCRLEMADAIAYLAKNPKVNTTEHHHTINTTLALEVINILPVCNLSQSDISWEPYAHIQNLTLVKEVMAQIGILSDYQLFFELVQGENATTICETPPTSTIAYLCKLFSLLPGLSRPAEDALNPDAEDASKLVDLRDHGLSTFWKNFEQSYHKMKSEPSPLPQVAKHFPTLSQMNSHIESTHTKAPLITFFTLEYRKRFNEYTTPKQAIDFFWSDQVSDYVEHVSNSGAFRVFTLWPRVASNACNTLKKHSARLWGTLQREGPRVMKCYRSLGSHLREVHDAFKANLAQTPGAAERYANLPIRHQWHILSSHFTRFDWRHTPGYRDCMHGNTHHTNAMRLIASGRNNGTRRITSGEDEYWTGFADASRKFYFWSLDTLVMLRCLPCWFLKFAIDCCNENGCMKQWPKVLDPTQIGCYYPEFELLPPGYSVWQDGFDPLNPRCEEDYGTYLSYGHALVWIVLSSSTSAWVQLRPEWAPWLDWSYYAVNGALPPNLFWCLIDQARVGLVVAVIAGSVLLTLGFTLSVLGVLSLFLSKRYTVKVPTLRGLWKRGEAWVRSHKSIGSLVPSSIADTLNDGYHLGRLARSFVVGPSNHI
jgi:hypothetical protein